MHRHARIEPILVSQRYPSNEGWIRDWPSFSIGHRLAIAEAVEEMTMRMMMLFLVACVSLMSTAAFAGTVVWGYGSSRSA